MAARSDFHVTTLGKDDLQVTSTGKVAFKSRDIAEAVDAEMAAQVASTQRAATNNCTCVNNCGPGELPM